MTTIETGSEALADGVVDLLPLDSEFHPGECGHIGEDHRPDRGGGIHDAATEFQYDDRDAEAPQPVRGPAQ